MKVILNTKHLDTIERVDLLEDYLLSRHRDDYLSYLKDQRVVTAIPSFNDNEEPRYVHKFDVDFNYVKVLKE